MIVTSYEVNSNFLILICCLHKVFLACSRTVTEITAFPYYFEWERERVGDVCWHLRLCKSKVVPANARKTYRGVLEVQIH